MLHVNNTYQTQYNMPFTSNPVQDDSVQNKEAPNMDKAKKHAAAYMIGATALASVVAVGILGRKGKLGSKLQKLLGGKPKKGFKPPETYGNKPKPPKPEGNNPKTPTQPTIPTTEPETTTPVAPQKPSKKTGKTKTTSSKKTSKNTTKPAEAETATQAVKTNCAPQENAKKVLGDLYEKVIAKAQKDGNTRRAKIFKQSKDNINSLDVQTVYGNLLDALYKDLRLGEYPTSSLVTKNIEEITAKGTVSIKVKNQNGWHYRMPIARKSGKSVDRISINALADEKLIKSLDDLFASGKVKGYYKTPETNLNWLERHDPITIYLDEQATPETLDAVKTACEKYIRSSEDVLSGKKFASGMALQKSPDEQDIKAVLEQAKNIDPILEDVLRKQFTDTASKKLITSAGYMDSAHKLIKLIQG